MSENDHETSLLDDKILSYLRSSQTASTHYINARRKDIQRHVLCKKNGREDLWSKKHFKRTLKNLAKRGIITKDGKTYSYNMNISRQFEEKAKNKKQLSKVDQEDAVEETLPNDVPIAQHIRQSMNEDMQNGEPEKVDLDEEIRRLEAELAADDDGSESDDGDDDVSAYGENGGSDSDTIMPSKRTMISFGENSVHEYDAPKSPKKMISQSQEDTFANDNAKGVICLSDLADERIEPLPQSALPQNKRRKLKGVDSTPDDTEESNKTRKKKRKRTEQQEPQQHVVSEGLKHAVQDLLQNYVRPSQLDRPPFYCRVCQHQSQSQIEFDSHRQSEFHMVAVAEERKRSYCKLCRKQLTSVVQMEEHLKSKPHRDRMDFVKGKQRGLIGAGDGGRRGRGRGGSRGSWQSHRGGGGAKSGSSGRQWC